MPPVRYKVCETGTGKGADSPDSSYRLAETDETVATNETDATVYFREGEAEKKVKR
jgi:hypothetical protein